MNYLRRLFKTNQIKISAPVQVSNEDTMNDGDHLYTENQMINFAKYVWYTKSLKDTSHGLSHYFQEWIDMGKYYQS